MLLKKSFVLCLAFVSLINAQNFCGIADKLTPFIINGSASKQVWPWIVAIFKVRDNSYMCGGTLIATNVVITAAHCIHPKNNMESLLPLHPTEIVLLLGKYNLSIENERGSVHEYPIEIIVHPEWKPFGEKYDSDIAMIILESKVKITSTVSPVCLWSMDSQPNVEKGTVVGWGKSESGAPYENTPKELEIFIRSNEGCFLKDPRFAAIASANTFCAGRDDRSGPCNGDSGSGLFLQSRTDFYSQWFLKGVVSAGFSQNGNCDVSADTLFTNVMKFLTWINQITNQKGIILPSPVLSTQENLPAKNVSTRNKEIFCFFESWAEGRAYDGAFSLDNLKPELCTTLVFLHAELENDKLKSIDPVQQLDENGGRNLYKRFTGLKQSHPHLRTLLSVGSWNEGSVKYSELAADSPRRKRFARNSAEYLKKYGFDGLHFHWEYPAHRGGSEDDRENFVLLLQDIKNVYKQQNLYLSACLRTQTNVAEVAYDLKGISKIVDAVLMMTYDFTGPWNKKVGFMAPLRGTGEDNVESRVNYFLKRGVPANKIILGLPFYGRSFITENEGNIGDITKGETGFAGPYFKEKGFLGFNEICRLQKIHEWEIAFDPIASQAIGKFKYDGLTKVTTYDTPRSVANKVQFMIEKNLGGVWMWFVDSDDFRGKCKEDSTTFADFSKPKLEPRKERDYPLLRTINDVIQLLGPHSNIL